MKVSEYTPLYGLLFNFDYLTGIDGKKMTVNEMFEKYPDFELTDIHINQLDTFDLFSLQTVLKDDCITEKIIVPYLRDMFDEYRQAGGNPFVWLHRTFESINLNPRNYKAKYRGILEKTLTEWIETFEKQPFDLLYSDEDAKANSFLETILNPKKKVDNIILRILKNEVSEFEIISEINAITNNETLSLFYNEFKNKFDLLSMEFYFNLDEKSIINAVKEAKTNKNHLHYIELCNDEINHIKPFIKKVENIDCFFNAFNLGNSQNPKVKEYLFLNDLMLNYDPLYDFTGDDKEFEDVYNSFGDLRFLNKISKYIENKKHQQPNPEPLDLSDTSAVEKIIYLNELGIIDFLRTKPEFITSTNLMATFLSAITDVKASTLQTSLNRLINNDTDDKNHPYQTKKTVERVRQTLIDKNIKPKTS